MTGVTATDDGWGVPTAVRAGSLSAPTRSAPPSGQLPPELDPRPRSQRRAQERTARRLNERGLPAWGGLLVLLVIAGIGGLIDTISGAQVRGGFNYGIVIASIVAILVVRRSSMFPIVIAPPLVYSAASAGMLYVRSHGLHDKRVLFDGAANWLVYGFPAIASASAAVVLIAGVRLLVRR